MSVKVAYRAKREQISDESKPLLFSVSRIQIFITPSSNFQYRCYKTNLSGNLQKNILIMKISYIQVLFE